MALTEEQPDTAPAGRPQWKAEDRPGLRGEQRPRAPAPADESEPGGLRKRLGVVRRHPFAAAVVALALIAAIIVGVIWWLNARQYESTSDAYIAARVVSVSAQVAGAVASVPVTDNQRVSAGATLAQINPDDYRNALDKAKAQLEQARASVANLAAQIDAQQARIDQARKQAIQAQAALQFAQQQNARYQALAKRGAGTQQQAQQAASDLTQKRAAYAAAKANVTAAQKQLPMLRAQQQSARAQVDAARAAIDQARDDLDETTIKASEAGRIAKLSVAKGDYLQPGQAMMALVPEKVWVVANFKETALADLRVGQPVTITVDAYPGKTFHGHVQSIQAGSGTAFSLLPPENATGNFVKVVQRVPVKIVFDHKPDVYLGPGMSVEPSVKVR
jgi:membrane fusion protein (multidrug efflux system)